MRAFCLARVVPIVMLRCSTSGAMLKLTHAREQVFRSGAPHGEPLYRQALSNSFEHLSLRRHSLFAGALRNTLYAHKAISPEGVPQRLAWKSAASIGSRVLDAAPGALHGRDCEASPAPENAVDGCLVGRMCEGGCLMEFSRCYR